MIWFGSVFSGTVNLARANPAGIVLLIAGMMIAVPAGFIAGRIRTEAREKTKTAIKLTGLIISAGGALLAILG